MADIPYIIFHFLVAVLNVAPFCHNIIHNNSAVVSLGFWNIWIPFQSAVNAVIWRDDVVDRAPAWCWISSKMYIGGLIGALAAPLCIARFLAQVVHPDAVAVTARDKRRRAVFDYSLCFGFPAFVIATHYIWQPARYGIMQAYGCQYTGINVWPLYVLFLVWPPVLATVAGIYAVYVFYRLQCHRRDWKKLVSASGSAISPERFLRLCGLCALYITVMLPLSIYAFVELRRAFGPLVSFDWGYIHFWEPPVYLLPEVTRVPFINWTPGLCAFIVAAFFGFSSESRGAYVFISRSLGLVALCHMLLKLSRVLTRRFFGDDKTTNSKELSSEKDTARKTAIPRDVESGRASTDQKCSPDYLSGLPPGWPSTT